MPDHVISPTLFDSIDEYVKLLDSGQAFSSNVVPETSPVISFSENAFLQFFENEIGSEIKGFEFKYKQRAARLRYSRKDGLSKQALALIVLFEQFCDIHLDVLGAGYGGQRLVLEAFHCIRDASDRADSGAGRGQAGRCLAITSRCGLGQLHDGDRRRRLGNDRMIPNDSVAEQVRLLERDYDQTAEFIRSVVGTTSTARGWAVTVWLAVLGVAIQQSKVALALLASIVVLPFGILDAYRRGALA